MFFVAATNIKHVLAKSGCEYQRVPDPLVDIKIWGPITVDPPGWVPVEIYSRVVLDPQVFLLPCWFYHLVGGLVGRIVLILR